MNAATLLTVAEAAEVLRGNRDRDTCEFVRGLIVDVRLSAIKHRGRWYVQRQSIDALAPDVVSPMLDGVEYSERCPFVRLRMWAESYVHGAEWFLPGQELLDYIGPEPK